MSVSGRHTWSGKANRKGEFTGPRSTTTIELNTLTPRIQRHRHGPGYPAPNLDRREIVDQIVTIAKADGHWNQRGWRLVHCAEGPREYSRPRQNGTWEMLGVNGVCYYFYVLWVSLGCAWGSSACFQGIVSCAQWWLWKSWDIWHGPMFRLLGTVGASDFLFFF